MVVHELRREQLVARALDETFAFFADAGNLQRITPPWLRFALLTAGPVEMRQGAEIDYRLSLHGIPLRWRALIEEWQPGRAFVDLQTRGPYRYWRHRHEFEAQGSATLVRDHVRYALPLGGVGEAAHRLLVRRDLARIFDFRRQAVRRLLG